MTTELTDKKNLFYILKTLSQGKIEKEVVMEHLGISDSTFYKHLNLIKETGFKIKRDKDVYELIKFKNLFNFAKNELSVFVYLLLVVYIILPPKKIKHFSNAIDKILSMSSKENAIEIEEKYEAYKMMAISQYYSEKIAVLNKYLNANRKIIIVLKTGEVLNIKPLDLIWIKEKLYLKYIDENEVLKQNLLDDIVKIAKKTQEINVNPQKEVVFELYGKLAKSYLLKEEESIVDYSKDKIVIVNHCEDKLKLFRRLLRYDILCKVTFPKADVRYFKSIIENSLENITKVVDNI